MSELDPRRASESGDAPIEPPAALLAFLELFERGEYWESHEALEGPWRANRSALYKGLILYASAWVHWQRGNAHGVKAQLQKAREHLAVYPDRYLGIDVESVRAHCGEAQARVARGAGWEADVRPRALRVEPSWIRGDEAELISEGEPKRRGPPPTLS
ncbi:MAG: DUF309 domain-containing protein [Planctomycetota bacterium]